MPRQRASGVVFAAVIVGLSLSALFGTKLLRGSRSEWDGQPFRNLRARAYDLFNRKEYAAAAELWQSGYEQAAAHHDTLSALRFLNNIGAVHYGLMHYQQAIDAFSRARELAAATGDRVTVTVARANLCSLYMQVGDMAAATAIAKEGLRLPADKTLSYRSRLLVTLGLLASRTGDSRKALEYFRDAVDEAEMNGADALRFEAWSNYAQELLNAGDLDGAERAALNSLRLGRLKTVQDSNPAYLILARISRARKDNRMALALIARGLAIPPRSSDHQLWRRYFLYERAMARLSEGQSAEALSDLRLALAYARRWREAIAPSDTLRSAAGFWLNRVYDAYIDAATRTDAAAEAFQAVEEERSASLVQALAERITGRDPGISRRLPESYWQDLASLRSAEIGRFANPKSYDRDREARIRERLSAAETNAGADLFHVIPEKDENILSRSTLLGVQRNLDPEEAILSFHSGASVSFLWALTSRRLEMHRLRPAGELAGLAERFHRAVEESAPERDRLGRELYSTLFGSLSAPVLTKRSWLIASDDSLFDIPFEVLVVSRPGLDRKRPVYLVERHETHRILSAFLHKTAPPGNAEGPFLAVGDGIYNAADERWRNLRPRSRLASFSILFQSSRADIPLQLPRLVSSRSELLNIARSWNSHTPPVMLTGVRASRESLVASLPEKPAVIHIAAHVLYPDGKPDDAFIHLGLRPNGAAEILTTRDVTLLPVSGALVVMSGCGSAAANPVRGAGIMGLTRAWLLAGARAVVGSRWPIQDDTGELFTSFYTHLASSRPGCRRPGEALRHAQLQMLRSNTWRSDPKYWGAFYLLTRD